MFIFFKNNIHMPLPGSILLIAICHHRKGQLIWSSYFFKKKTVTSLSSKLNMLPLGNHQPFLCFRLLHFLLMPTGLSGKSPILGWFFPSGAEQNPNLVQTLYFYETDTLPTLLIGHIRNVLFIIELRLILLYIFYFSP